MDLPKTLQGYLEGIKEGELPSIGQGPLLCDELLKKRVLALAGSRFGGPITRSVAIRRIFARAVEIGLIQNVRLQFSLLQKERAYVKGQALLSFSLPYVCKESGATLVKVLLHELAHLILLAKDGYGKLLSLHHSYKQEVSFEDERLKILSPVELYATLISIQLMQDVVADKEGKAKVKDKIQAKISEEEKKLRFALNQYKNSSI